MAMADFNDFKLFSFALPLALAAWRWLRSHNDRTLAPPPSSPNDARIERLVREGRKIEAIKAIRKSYPYDLQQARQHLKGIQKRQRGTRT